MKRAVLGRVVLGLVILQASACADPLTGPGPIPPPAATPAPAPPPPPPPSPPLSGVEFPPVPRPARVFGSPTPLLPYPLTSITQASRVLLYDDRTFGVQYLPEIGPAFEFTGAYTESGAQIEFRFDRWPSGSAVGSLSDNSLTITYNLYLHLTDFEDAVYTLTEVVKATAAGAGR